MVGGGGARGGASSDSEEKEEDGSGGSGTVEAVPAGLPAGLSDNCNLGSCAWSVVLFQKIMYLNVISFLP